MANVYKDISEFVQKVAATGNEEFQVSATEKVTAQQIADLASSGLNVYTISESESQNQKIDASRVEELKKSELVLFPNEVSYTPYFKVSVDNSKAYFITGNIPINSQGQPGINNGEEPPFEQVQTVMIEVDLTTYDITIWPYPVIKKSWFKGDVSVIEITDFAIPSVNITKDGQSFLFYANDASNIPNSNHGATSFVGVAIASPIFITGDQRLLYYMMVDTVRGMFYTGRADTVDDTVAWNTTPITRLGQAVQVTAFTESALSSLLYTYKAGDFIPFYTSSVTASEANQFPESGVFNGFISMGSNEGDYFQIFAFKTGSPKAYIGACIGSTTQWTALGDSSEGRGPIPGYKTLVSSWSSSVTTGSTGIINFREEIPKASRILVVAQIRSSPTGSATIRANVPLTLASINDSGQGILFDLSLQYLATGTNIGSIRLICTSLITGANGVQGMNTIVQSNNLANAGDIIQLSLYYK
jgi:hypothetical protein